MFGIIIIIILFLFWVLINNTTPNNNNIQENINIIDNLNGMQFERYFAELLKTEGFYSIQVTKGSGDYGVDIIAIKDKQRYAFQCKRYSKKVGPKPIGEVLRGMKMYDCSKGVVITNNYFTEQAKKEAIVCNVELWDRNKISSILKRVNKKIIDDTMSIEENQNKDCQEEKVIEKFHKKKEECKVSQEERKMQEMTLLQYKEIAKKIQLLYFELGYKVMVTDINTKSKYTTTYRIIHENNVDILSIGNQIINKIGCENVRIRNDDDKHIKIIIPKEVSWNENT